VGLPALRVRAPGAVAGLTAVAGLGILALVSPAKEDVMTSLPGRPNTAMLVVDVQNDVVAGAAHREAVIANIAWLVARARAADVPVVWVQHSDEELPRGSAGWEYVPELQREESEPVVHKGFGDSFEDTGLEELLASLGVGHLVVAGAQTDACIRSTLHGAVVRGYDATLVSDAHTTEDQTAWGAPPPEVVIDFTNLYWAGHAAPGRRGRVVATADVQLTSP
jgi:hypothetical protein